MNNSNININKSFDPSEKNFLMNPLKEQSIIISLYN